MSYLVTTNKRERCRPWVIRRGARGPIVARFGLRKDADEYLRGFKRLLAVNERRA